MIPDEAVEVAAKSLSKAAYGDWGLVPDLPQGLFRRDAQAALEEAAPYIVVSALESAADAIEQDPYEDLDPFYAGWLRDRARKLREGDE